MTYLIGAVIALAVALVIIARRYLHLHRAARSLHQAIRLKQPLLRETLPGSLSENWEQLCHETNDLIAESARLETQRSGQLAQLEATLGSLREAVLIVDGANYVLLANKALSKIFPRAINILHQRLERVLHSVEFLAYVEAVRKNEAEPQHEMEFTEGERTLWVEVTGTTIPSPNGDGGAWALFVLHDITKLKRLEVVRKEFVANVSHELRTPLSVIKGYVETLVDDHQTMPLADRDRFLRTIQRHTERLNALLEDLLTLSRLESINPGLRREPADLAKLIDAVVEDIRTRAEAADHVVHVEVDARIGEVLIDARRLTQVFENLLQNACKYTPKGSRIEVTARIDGTQIEACVRDNGPGIPAEDLPHIFERFYRVEKGRAREKGGTGLGLSIVKHIVQLHGGRVWAESGAGQGTAFFLRIPLRPAT